MQDKFLLRAIKKIAPVVTGAVMLGATLTGAMALDLNDYPEPFVENGVYDDSNLFVVGSNAAATDTLGVLDIGMNMQFMAKTAVASDSTSLSVEGGTTKQVAIGLGLTNVSLFDTAIQDDDVSSLFDGEVSFQGSAYDTSEELQMTDVTNPLIATSLTSGEDDYESNIFLEVTAKDKIRYAYKFDESINVSLASSSQPLIIDFLGKQLKITNVDVSGANAGTKFTAYVGDEHYLMVGDTVTVVGKVVTLVNVASASAVVDVDGVQEIINSGSTQDVNGVEVTIDSVFDRTNLDESAANLVLGEQSEQSYKDADAYLGEDENDPDWVWDIGGTGTGEKLTDEGTNQILRIENDFIFDGYEDNPPAAGDCIALPNDYLEICFDSLSVKDTGYATYVFEWTNSEDFTDSVPGLSGKPALHIEAEGQSEGWHIQTQNLTNYTTAQYAQEFWLYKPTGNTSSVGNASGPVDGNFYLDVFFKDTNNKIKWMGASSTGDSRAMAKVHYENTKDSNIQLKVYNTSEGDTDDTNLFLYLDIIGDSADELADGVDDLVMMWGLTAANGTLDSLGATRATEEGGELRWGPTQMDLGTRDEDHRSTYGMIIKDPKSQSSSDRVEVSIPNDQVKANIVIKGTSTTVTSGDVTYQPVDIDPASTTADKVSSPTAYNLILVGGPCANALVESLDFGLTCSGWAYNTGEAVVRLIENGDNVALLVAGTTADDTVRAAKAVANYDEYDFEGTEVLVTGTSDADITVAADVATVEEPEA